jgi:hypothetical protein
MVALCNGGFQGLNGLIGPLSFPKTSSVRGSARFARCIMPVCGATAAKMN